MTSLQWDESEGVRSMPATAITRRPRNPTYSPVSAASPRETLEQWSPKDDSGPLPSFRFEQNDESLQRFPSNDAPSPRVTRPTSSNSRPSNASSHYYSLYPAPSKPLPPIPTAGRKPSQRISTDSAGRSSTSTSRSSQVSVIVPVSDRTSVSSSDRRPRSSQPSEHRVTRRATLETSTSAVDVSFWKLLQSEEKKANTVHYLDISATSSTLASKYGNNIIKFWSMASGTVESVIKISAYTEAHSRSRDYLIRSHAILCESSTLVAIASKFGRSIEVWNWEKKKCLQSVDNADRWAAGREDCYDNGWSPLAVYHGTPGTIDLYAATRDKKPLVKNGTIDLKKAGLPFIPQYPELALSATSPLLVAAAGPRPPRPGHPPPDRETLLVAWEAHGDGNVSSTPYRVARPWQHEDLDTAIPCELATYGSVVVSIWIPATYRAVAKTHGDGYTLTSVTVLNRHVLVWDLTANSTRAFSIPNTTSCISPDCRFVAYCQASKTNRGARGCLVILDVITGADVWSFPDRNALAIDSGPKPEFKQFDDLGKITELAFSADGQFLVVGDEDGRNGVYKVREQSTDKYHAR